MTNLTPQPPKAPSNRSIPVQLALFLFSLALLGALIAIGVPAVAPLAIVVGLTGVGVSVLSLRENM